MYLTHFVEDGCFMGKQEFADGASCAGSKWHHAHLAAVGCELRLVKVVELVLSFD
jgi:hypothetical protein